MTMTVNGNMVQGEPNLATLGNLPGVELSGTVNGNTLTGTLTGWGAMPACTVTLSPDGSSFTGTCFYGGVTGGWSGTRAGP